MPLYWAMHLSTWYQFISHAICMDPHYSLQNLDLDLDPDPDTTQAEIKWKSKTKDPLPCHVAKIFELYFLGLLLFDIQFSQYLPN